MARATPCTATTVLLVRGIETATFLLSSPPPQANSANALTSVPTATRYRILLPKFLRCMCSPCVCLSGLLQWTRPPTGHCPLHKACPYQQRQRGCICSPHLLLG